MSRNNNFVLIQIVFYIIIYELNISSCQSETFINANIEWCNGTSSYDPSRICEKSSVAKSNSLADNLPVDSLSYIGILNQTIPVLKENSLSNLEIQKLEVVSCGVLEIQKGFLTNSSTSELRITRNGLKKISKDIFNGASVQYTVDFSENVIKTIEDDTFSGMVLSSLDLSSNNLTDIPPGVFRNLTVEHLSLERNGLQSISRSMFQDIVSMQLLSLGYNSITDLEPGSLSKLVSPAFVYLYDNLIETIPSGVFEGNTYVELILSNNKIKTIADGAFDKSAVVYLTLTNNSIEEIRKESFKGCITISYLTLDFNAVNKIEPHALDFVDKGIYLGDNQLEVVKANALKFVRIVVLLNNPKLKKIEVGAFDDHDRNHSLCPVEDRGKIRDLYLEFDNNLDQESTRYLRQLNSSGKLLWRGEITDRVLFPFD